MPIFVEDRLEIDTPTLPLAELLLAKMQIVKINEKDLVDMIALLLEHSFGESDGEILNVARISKLCAEDWGLWRTSTMNLEKLQGYADSHANLDSGQKARLLAQVDCPSQTDRRRAQATCLAAARKDRRKGEVVQRR